MVWVSHREARSGYAGRRRKGIVGVLVKARICMGSSIRGTMWMGRQTAWGVLRMLVEGGLVKALLERHLVGALVLDVGALWVC